MGSSYSSLALLTALPTAAAHAAQVRYLLVLICRFGVGVSAYGSMYGTPNTNAIICNPGAPGGPTAYQYDMLSYSFSDIRLHATSGTTNISCVQNAGQTIMSWTRLSNNGDNADAQIEVVSGDTYVVYAIGPSNTFDATTPDTMFWAAVDFTQQDPSGSGQCLNRLSVC